ncbi:hypothetical protein [Campylobacter sp. VTCC 70190]|uniref:hypothetical protein n=1 Tax=Campylobacter sp. VTCC 70190 TaxID=3392118 RepID=UPI00398F88A6
MKQWLSDFKLALIKEDLSKLESLLDELDIKAFVQDLAQNSAKSFSGDNVKENVNEIFYQIKALLSEAITLIEQKKKTKAVEIQKFQKALTYLKA